MKRRILLVEPAYRNKYPPMGLMKISNYHKERGDYVQFVKGCHPDVRAEKWDRIYVSTLFTFHWGVTVRTIQYYARAVPTPHDVMVGGVLASLMPRELMAATGATVIQGLIDQPGMLDEGDRKIVDNAVPDYGMLAASSYSYGLDDAYIGYATRGCPNRCRFCAVSRIEPEFVHYLPLKQQVQKIEALYGTKQDLVLLDNNVLASDRFETIIRDIQQLGFYRGARLNRRLRSVDFNQGVDLRLLTRKKMALLAGIALRPLRLAFDAMSLRPRYERAVRLAHDHGLSTMSNYVLYNYVDTPEDFYDRLRLNVEINEELGSKISSFPMKYVPLDAKDRSHVGKHWNRRLLRGIQCILLVTKGMVGPSREFFDAAFGPSYQDFLEIALMPDDYIIHRRAHDFDGADEWRKTFRRLSARDRETFAGLVSQRPVPVATSDRSLPKQLRDLLSHYAPPPRQGD